MRRKSWRARGREYRYGAARSRLMLRKNEGGEGLSEGRLEIGLPVQQDGEEGKKKKGKKESLV